MSLELEEQIIREPMRGIPAVPYSNFFILTVTEFFSSKSVMFNEINYFQIENGS